MLPAVAALLTSVNLYAAEPGQPKDEPAQKNERKSLNPPAAAEPVMPGTIDRPPQAIAPGTVDTPPKPAAPGTLDKNVRNPDVEIQKGAKPIPR